jgi:BASS family bile acid:Na+ symporter
MQTIRTNPLYALAFLCLIIGIGLVWTPYREAVGIFLTFFFIFLAFAFRSHDFLKGFSYTMTILGAVTVAMFFPQWFKQVGDFQLKTLITPLLQIIMFGMGTTMSLKDFTGVIQMPKAVIIGILCQFTIMPFLGWSIAKAFGFEAEIAAGVILIGCSPSGLASNVMSYLAKANVALSITLTAIATLLAPILTPFLMEMLAGQLIEIKFWKMVLDITYIVIIPIVIGLIFNKLFYGKAKWLDKLMPIVSMAGIAVIITIITASGRDNLIKIGLLLIFATFIHNIFGYLLGYWSSRLLGMDEKACRTVAIEVGLQNGGLASGLAVQMGKEATVGLAPAIFGPLMNITGSLLANWWSNKPPKEAENEN